MNTSSHNLHLSVAPNQLEEVTKALFHTILLHRTTGKYSYSVHHNGTFSVGTLGTEDVDCSTVDFTYVRCNSSELDQYLSSQLEGLTGSLCNQQQGARSTGKVKLEFYERKKSRWLLPPEASNWEIWSLTVDIVQPRSELEWEAHQGRLVEGLIESVLYITEAVNRSDYVPRNPPQDNVASVFDISLPTIQPYLHKVTFELGGDSVAGSVRKFIRDTFAYNY